MNVFSRSTALAGLTVVALTVAGCGSSDSMSGMSSSSVAGTAASSTAPSTTASSSEPMASMSPSSSSDAPAGTGSEVNAEHNAADVSFAQLMIEHHRGAIEMAQLAPDRAASQEVKDLAAKIEAAQTPEIELMTSWLQAWDAATSTGGMDMGTTGGMNMGGTDTSTSSSETAGMPGMMTAEQMTALTAATGSEFDQMFLEMMVWHHQGAVEMADTEIAQGANPEALALAESIKTSQTAEIAEMQQLLQGM